jgi:hypothetical protein
MVFSFLVSVSYSFEIIWRKEADRDVFQQDYTSMEETE